MHRSRSLKTTCLTTDVAEVLLHVTCYIMRLEVEFGEEPLVLTGLMLFFQSLLDNLLGFFSLRWLVQGVWGDSVLERLNVQRVSGWHQVVVVDQLDEWLDLGSLGNLLLVVSSGNLQWASLNADNDSVWEGVGLGTVIVWSDNDNLLACESTTGNDSWNLLVGELGHGRLGQQSEWMDVMLVLVDADASRVFVDCCDFCGFVSAC